MICDHFLTENCHSSCSGCSGCLISSDNRQTVVCQENGQSYKLLNPNHSIIYKYHLDGGAIKNDCRKKCDYLIYINVKKIIILVELKGVHISSAVQQLLGTIDILNNKIKTFKVYGRIVGTHVPAMLNTSDSIKLIKILKKTGGDLKTKSIQLNEQEIDF